MAVLLLCSFPQFGRGGSIARPSHESVWPRRTELLRGRHAGEFATTDQTSGSSSRAHGDRLDFTRDRDPAGDQQTGDGGHENCSAHRIERGYGRWYPRSRVDGSPLRRARRRTVFCVAAGDGGIRASLPHRAGPASRSAVADRPAQSSRVPPRAHLQATSTSATGWNFHG